MGSKEGSFKYQLAEMAVAEMRTTIGMSVSIVFC